MITTDMQNMRMKYRIINSKPAVQQRGETEKRKCRRVRLLL